MHRRSKRGERSVIDTTVDEVRTRQVQMSFGMPRHCAGRLDDRRGGLDPGVDDTESRAPEVHRPFQPEDFVPHPVCRSASAMRTSHHPAATLLDHRLDAAPLWPPRPTPDGPRMRVPGVNNGSSPGREIEIGEVPSIASAGSRPWPARAPEHAASRRSTPREVSRSAGHLADATRDSAASVARAM